MKTNIVYNKDCKEVIAELPNEEIDCIISDPPYGLNKEGIANDGSLWGYELDYYRLLKDNSWLCLYCSIGEIANVIKLIQNQGFRYQWQHITYIDNGMVRGRIGFNNFMCCLIFSKGDAKLRNITKDVYKCSTSSQQRNSIAHPSPKKTGAISQLIKGFTNEGDLVFDPFAGSGTTLVACKEKKRKYIGCEIEKRYYDIIIKRLSQTTLWELENE